MSKDVTLKEMTFVYRNGSINVLLVGDRWRFEVVCGDTVLTCEDAYLTWQAAKQNARLWYKAAFGEELIV